MTPTRDDYSYNLRVRKRIANARLANARIANDRRAEIGARRQVAEANKALLTLKKFEGHPATQRRPARYSGYVEALVLRVENPRLTLDQIATTQRITKNAYWSRLRRAFEYAAWFERNAA